MPLTGFALPIPAIERLQTYALDSTSTGIGTGYYQGVRSVGHVTPTGGEDKYKVLVRNLKNEDEGEDDVRSVGLFVLGDNSRIFVSVAKGMDHGGERFILQNDTGTV